MFSINHYHVRGADVTLIPPRYNKLLFSWNVDISNQVVWTLFDIDG